ncbi:MAG: ArsR family transcriptional regulator [Candidatus Methanoperedens sp.]|nr:ArsR family transcriptional regulator [Candidatus Methanoperedens sp.]MCZ7369678.1 ArsR family transcriptional regulator [Candidatus Methanoperedens sp.]
MSTESLIDLSKKLSRNSRVDILEKLCMKSCRVRDLSDDLDISKERISEALTDLVSSRLVIKFESEAIIVEPHSIYVISPFGSEILDISDKLDSIKGKVPEKIRDFGDGIGYILNYCLEADFKVNHNARKIKEGIRINMDIEKRTPCEKKNCEITCEPVIKNIVKRFGSVDQFEKGDHANCSFNIKLIRK